jgi:nucleotide-binding universal stress UspA family protein
MSVDSGAVVVGMDGSDESKHALRWAARQAQRTGANLRVIQAWVPPRILGYVPDDVEPDYEKAKSLLMDDIQEVLGPEPPVPVTATVVKGHSAEVLVDASREADLLVVGSRGHGAFAGMLLGSTSHHCVHHATSPVVVVRPSTGELKT